MLKSISLLFWLSILALLDGVTAQDNNRGGGNNNGNNNNGNNNNNNGNNNNNAGATLDPSVIQSASASNGNPKDGQAASTTDKFNFINFCKGKTITNGKQLTGGGCSLFGDLPPKDKMISAIIVNPVFGQSLQPNTPFDIQVQTQNLVAGKFTNPDNTYYAAPQQLQGGQVIGHCHVVVQKLGSLTDKTPPNAATFAFFKGINDAGNNRGLLKASVTAGLPAGIYRICTMVGAMNHQPPLMPVAQRGAQDDCIRLEVKAGGNGNNAGNNAGNNNNNNSGGRGNGASTTTSAAASTSSAANGNNNNNNNGNNNGGNNGNRGGQAGNNGQTTTSARAATTTTPAAANNGRGGQGGNNPQTTTTTTSTVANNGRGGRNSQNNNADAGNVQTNRGDVTPTPAANSMMMDEEPGRNGRNRGQRYAHRRRASNEPEPMFQKREYIV